MMIICQKMIHVTDRLLSDLLPKMYRQFMNQLLIMTMMENRNLGIVE